jgi:hypothetical protein
LNGVSVYAYPNNRLRTLGSLSARPDERAHTDEARRFHGSIGHVRHQHRCWNGRLRLSHRNVAHRRCPPPPDPNVDNTIQNEIGFLPNTRSSLAAYILSLSNHFDFSSNGLSVCTSRPARGPRGPAAHP